jgi:NTP pyrophosphatase (non-canonical NTP hydrolase)
MSLNKSIQKIISEYSKKEPKTIEQQLIKLQEEHGELSVAILQRFGLKSPKGKSIKEIEENILEEACDMVIMLMSIIAHFNFDNDAVDDMIKAKLSKWEGNLGNIDKWKKELVRASKESI